jgi:hypothetical protein
VTAVGQLAIKLRAVGPEQRHATQDGQVETSPDTDRRVPVLNTDDCPRCHAGTLGQFTDRPMPLYPALADLCAKQLAGVPDGA